MSSPCLAARADRQADQEDDQPGGQDRPEGVDEAAVDQHGRAHRFQHQKGGAPKAVLATRISDHLRKLRGVKRSA
jgi:hypothetical protein